MILTSLPAEVVPLLDECLPEIRNALLTGIDFANDIQPEADGRDRWFWAHSARYRARRSLESSADAGNDWALVSG